MTTVNDQLALVPHSYQGSLIPQRAADGYINATAMCKAAGKLWGHYHENATTTAFLSALSSDIGIPISKIIQSVKGGNADQQGTWVNPQVAVHLAQWLSPEFAVKVSQWVVEWMSGINPIDKVWKQFEDRVSLVYDNVPDGYFCIFREVADLFASLISNGATPGTHMILDLSVGQHWAIHWKTAKLSDVHGERCYFDHFYPSYFPQSYSNPQAAACYPENALPLFRRWVRESYIPHKMPEYLKSQVKMKKLPAQIANNALAALASRQAGRAMPRLQR